MTPMPTLPPALAVGALYDSLLQSALTQFFERATLETEALPSPSSDGRLAIEPTKDPSALSIRWFGNRYTLRVPPARPFTPQEVRFARAIGAVLSARYRAILSPQLMVERGDLFRGAIEDRYVGAFFDREPYQLQPRRAAAGRPGRAGARDDACRGALDLREPADLDRGAACSARKRIRSAAIRRRNATRCTTRAR